MNQNTSAKRENEIDVSAILAFSCSFAEIRTGRRCTDRFYKSSVKLVERWLQRSPEWQLDWQP